MKDLIEKREERERAAALEEERIAMKEAFLAEHTGKQFNKFDEIRRNMRRNSRIDLPYRRRIDGRKSFCFTLSISEHHSNQGTSLRGTDFP